MGIKKHLSKIPILDDILYFNSIEKIVYKMMLSYCLKSGENTKGLNLQVSRAINSGIIKLSKCVVYGDKKSKFIKNQQANGLLNNLVIGKLLNKIPIIRYIFL